MKKLFFIHIPKTGGTSFRSAVAAALAPDEVLFLYGKEEGQTSEPVRKAFYENPEIPIERRRQAVSDLVADPRIRFFTSHVHTPHLPCFDPGLAAVLLRDPVDRVLSHYLHDRRTPNAAGSALSLEAFIELRNKRNLQARHLRGLDLAEIGVVGVLDRYAAFVARVGERHGLDLVVRCDNRAPLASRLRGSMISSALRRRIADLNAEDMALYEQALRMAA